MHLDRVIVEVKSEELKPLLLLVASRVEGFDSGDVEQLCADVAALEPDDDVLVEPEVSFGGVSVPFALDVFKDAEGALEVVFLLAPDLRPLVEEAAYATVGKPSVRSLPVL